MSGTDSLCDYHSQLTADPIRAASDLDRYAALLTRWNATHNLVSRETIATLWHRHIADSLQVLTELKPDDTTFVDLGSGGGLPAIPIAIARRQSHLLIEPVGKKAAFLKTVGRELDLGLQVRQARASASAVEEPVDVITSRALAPLKDLLPLIAPFFGLKTRAILHKGREHVDELAESAASWHYDVVIQPSRTDPGGVLLTITNLVAKSSR